MKARVVICGAAGRMGRMLVRLVADHERAEVVAAVEAAGHPAVGRDVGEVAAIGPLGVRVGAQYEPAPDTVTLDFTTPAATLAHLEKAAAAAAAMVIGTTGFTPEQRRTLERLAPSTRVVFSPNMSLGVNLLMKLARTAAAILDSSFDIEIVEMHHRRKVDAPSGTALELGRQVARARGQDLEESACFGRHGAVGARRDGEIGFAALRGGDVVGDHTVIFAGEGERLELTHRAQSRECLARGALAAALWLIEQPPGLYSMAHVLGLESAISS